MVFNENKLRCVWILYKNFVVDNSLSYHNLLCIIIIIIIIVSQLTARSQMLNQPYPYNVINWRNIFKFSNLITTSHLDVYEQVCVFLCKSWR